MSKLWFSADTHFGHKNIIEYCDRPFDSVDEMDRELIANWNETVAMNDDVYFLGDFSLNFKRVKQVVPLLHGKIHLVAGNHDLCHSSNNGYAEYIRRYKDAGFSDVCESIHLDLDSCRVLCHHMPYFDKRDYDRRFPEFKPVDDGGWLLHGHVHERWKQNGRQINVGVDVWDYYPVSADELVALIKSCSAD